MDNPVGMGEQVANEDPDENTATPRTEHHAHSTRFHPGLDGPKEMVLQADVDFSPVSLGFRVLGIRV